MLYRDHKRTIFSGLFISVFTVTGTILIFYYIGQSMNLEMDLAGYFFVVPIGLTVSAVPLLPGGIGVGQVAFYTLFAWTGSQSPELGGTLCTTFQVYTMLFNAIGSVFYFRFKRSPAMATRLSPNT